MRQSRISTSKTQTTVDTATLPTMRIVLVAADALWVRNLVRVACAGNGLRVIEVARGRDVRETVAEQTPDVVVLDMQIGNMGGMAVAVDLRLEAGAGRLPQVAILLLLDREADRFLANRTAVEPRRSAASQTCNAPPSTQPTPSTEPPPPRLCIRCP